MRYEVPALHLRVDHGGAVFRGVVDVGRNHPARADLRDAAAYLATVPAGSRVDAWICPSCSPRDRRAVWLDPSGETRSRSAQGRWLLALVVSSGLVYVLGRVSRRLRGLE